MDIYWEYYNIIFFNVSSIIFISNNNFQQKFSWETLFSY
jgi:hypothetical protein